MKCICVFCGSSFGADTQYRQAAAALGKLLANDKLTLVYGGGDVGLMGAIADAALAAGGRVIGIIPQALARFEVAHRKLGDLRIVGSMHERKALMADLSDAFVALPGGAGTLDEFAEIFTWAQLGIHKKPFGILNIAGYFDPLISFFDKMVQERFMKPEHRSMLIVEKDPLALLDRLQSYHAPDIVDRWAELVKRDRLAGSR
jgi:uncharacterized protein (TIGR00730 family)